MEYIEPDGSSFGHNIDSTKMGLELYRLTAMFLSVGPIEEISSKARQSGKGLVEIGLPQCCGSHTYKE